MSIEIDVQKHGEKPQRQVEVTITLRFRAAFRIAQVFAMDDDSRMSDTSSMRNRGQRQAASTVGDLDGVGDASSLSGSRIRPQLRCNACWEPILTDAQSAETCYRTSCGHLFCVGLQRLFGSPCRAVLMLTFVCCRRNAHTNTLDRGDSSVLRVKSVGGAATGWLHSRALD